VAAFVGPNLANMTRDLIEAAPFAASFFVLVGLYIMSFVVLAFLKLPPKPITEAVSRNSTGRTLKVIAAQPMFIVALICGMLGYGIMALAMTATPLAMHHFAYPFSKTSFVIQWHVFGMFVPSFFTGQLIRKFGTANIMLAGVLLLGLCVGINFTGTTVTHFWGSLIFLGLGWNFLFVGATTQLTTTYASNEKAKAQALNDFIVFGTVSLTSLSSGAVQNTLGWATINMAVVPLLLLIALANLWLRGKPGQKIEQLKIED